jgi:hypothetical protein
MKVRTAIGRTGLRARLTAAGCYALILLCTAVVSACGGSGSSATTLPSITIISSLTGSGSASEATSPTSGTTTVTVTPTQTTTATVTPTASPSPSPSPIPTQAPVTGGGGTAGFQDGLLLALGAAAIVAGAGGIAYRRRLTRNR